MNLILGLGLQNSTLAGSYRDRAGLRLLRKATPRVGTVLEAAGLHWPPFSSQQQPKGTVGTLEAP